MEKSFKSFIDKIKGMAKSKNKLMIIVGIGAAGIMLIFLSELLPKPKPAEVLPSAPVQMSDIEYCNLLQQNLEEIVSGINGAGKCKVMVTLENGIEYIYATNDKQSSDKKAEGAKNEVLEYTLVIIDAGGGKKEALVRTAVQPKIKGVVILCQGADNTTVQTRIVSAVSTVLAIGYDKVCVVKGN